MVRIELNENLDSLVNTTNLTTSIFELIQWAERNGRVLELIDGAVRQRPDNIMLHDIAQQLFTDCQSKKNEDSDTFAPQDMFGESLTLKVKNKVSNAFGQMEKHLSSFNSTIPLVIEAPVNSLIHLRSRFRWFRTCFGTCLGICVIVGVLLTIIIGIKTYQAAQRNAQATALAQAASIRIAHAIPSATALAMNAYTIMEQRAPQLLPLAEQYDMQFVLIPAGQFIMGSTEVEIDAALDLCNQYNNQPCQRDWFTDEAPQHTVTTGAYWIGLTELTNAQYRPFIDAGGYDNERWWTAAGWQWRQEKSIEQPLYWTDSMWNGDNQPVVGISWYEATAYANWLSNDIGVAIRLPTEAEWERAARGDQGLIFPWDNEWNGALANYCDANCKEKWKDESTNDGYENTAPVGSYPDGASPFGALDMAGNVPEWTNSLDLAYPYSLGEGREDVNGEGSRVLRGGSWYTHPNSLRGAYRYRVSPVGGPEYWGVRLVVLASPN